jgi:hypothetical protein
MSSNAGFWIGKWRNDKNSLMHIKYINELNPGEKYIHRRIEGTYRTGVGLEDSKIEFPLTGFVIGDVICFSVSYHSEDKGRDVRSIATWAGQYLPNPRNDGKSSKDDPREVLKTVWHLASDLSDGEHEDEYGWLIAGSGFDVFTKIEGD